MINLINYLVIYLFIFRMVWWRCR